MNYLDLDDLRAVAASALDGPMEVRDWGLLESALARPQATVFGEDAYPSVWEKAAALLLSLVGNHALVDGNKRVGFTCVVLFLHKNAVHLSFGEDSAYEFVIAVAERRIADVVAAAMGHTGASVDSLLMASTNDLKNGMVLDLDNGLWSVIEFQHVKPGKGGAFVRTTLKNVLSGKVVDKTFNAGTKVDVAIVDKRDMTFLYKEGTDYVFMDSDTFDQVYVPEPTLGTVKDYLLENMGAMVAMHEGAALYVELPASVELLVAHTDPVLQGDRSTGGTKPATLETGAEIQVPLFLTTGEKIKVDTRDGRYLGRINEKN